MNVLENNKDKSMDLSREIVRLCQLCHKCEVEVERKEEGYEAKERLKKLCGEEKKMMGINTPDLLLALMDAYEVTRDEKMLQEVLDVVSENLERLEPSAVNVMLLSYCFYYVEEEECAQRAKGMLEVLRGEKRGEELENAERVYRELVEDI
ncbi:MAG: hypothetical protein RR397_09615 [Odoribacter sp.]